MRFILLLLLALTIAVLAGFGTAYLAVEQGAAFGRLDVGVWRAWPGLGKLDSDPYSKAYLVRQGHVVMAAGEGLAFHADQDEEGQVLSRACTYKLVGKVPVAGLWTLHMQNENTTPLQNTDERSGFHSLDLLYRADSSFEITLSAKPSPGNWLPVRGTGSFRLIMRLYDTPIRNSAQLVRLHMPRILKGDCRS